MLSLFSLYNAPRAQKSKLVEEINSYMGQLLTAAERCKNKSILNNDAMY